MSGNYEEQNQREAATKIAECTDLPAAIEYLAQWADWKCGDPKAICENIADYIRSNVINCETCNGLGTIDLTLGGWSTDDPAAACPDCEGTGEFRPAHPTQFLIQKQKEQS